MLIMRLPPKDKWMQRENSFGVNRTIYRNEGKWATNDMADNQLSNTNSRL